jgi:hypothetical protein
MAYHTSKTGAPHVYHTYKDCPEGKKIEKMHYVAGRGTDRRLCEVCEAKG